MNVIKVYFLQAAVLFCSVILLNFSPSTYAREDASARYQKFQQRKDSVNPAGAVGMNGVIKPATDANKNRKFQQRTGSVNPAGAVGMNGVIKPATGANKNQKFRKR